MAIFHLHIQIITRGKGKSAVAAAAYRSGEKITNNYDGQTHDFTRKGSIVHTEILLPNHAPKEFADRSTLWNSVEKIEKSINSQLAREMDLALPREASLEQQKVLVREYCEKYFVSQGMVADVCIHDKDDGNPHAHIMLTMRPIEPDGSWGTKQRKEYILDENGGKIYDKKKRQYKCKTVQTTDWNEQTKAEEWREGWTDSVNRFLKNENIVERVDHRSFERQGIEQIPTIHMGVAATQMERKGIVTERGEINRKAKSANKELHQVKARLNKLNKWLEDMSQTDTPNLQYIISKILNGNGNRTQWQKVFDLKKAASMYNFLSENGISTLPQLQEKLTEIRSHYNDISDKMKAKERRLKTLSEHISHAEKYQKYKAVYRQYEQQKPKNKETFYEAYRMELTHYEAADNYLKRHLNGHKTIPLKSWKAEAASVEKEKSSLYREFQKLRDEVREVESIRYYAERIVSAGEQVQINLRNKGMEL